VDEYSDKDKKMEIVAQDNMSTKAEVTIREVGDLILEVEEEIFK
jgi:hypothetical protein